MPVSPIVLAACKAYALHFGAPKHVFYPGCGNDATPSTAFKDAQVVYVDPVQAGLDEIRALYPTAVAWCGKAEDIPPGVFYDLVLDVHSHAPFEAEVRDLRRAGHLLIANKMSDRAFDSAAFELVAAIMLSRGKMVVDTALLERYQEVDPNHPENSFSNRRKVKAPFYVFKKVA